MVVGLLKDRSIQTIGWGIWGLCLIYGFRFAVRKDKPLTTDEAIALTPDAAELRWHHQVLGSAWTIGSLVGLIGFDRWFTQGQFIHPAVLGIAFASVAAFDGFFAARTGIYSVSDRWRFRYVVDTGARLRQLGKLQGWLSVATCFVGILVAYFITPS
jgi:hypothetical protein